MSDLGGTMNENLRDKIAEALSQAYADVRDGGPDAPSPDTYVTDAVLAVVGPELDRLRAEVKQLQESERTAWAVHREHVDGMGPIIARHAGDATFARIRAKKAEAERDVLRERLAKVEALLPWWEEVASKAESAAKARHDLSDANELKTHAFATRRRMDDLRAALASVPEPSDSEPCTTPGCPGDGRYAAPGRRHAVGCKYPQPSDSEVCECCGVSEATGLHDGKCNSCRQCGEPAPDADRRPHSRACGIKRHDHGPDCHRNCPTCGGAS